MKLRQKIGLWVVFIVYSLCLLVYGVSSFDVNGFIMILAFFVPLALLVYLSFK